MLFPNDGGVSQEFLTPRVMHTNLPAIHHLQFRFSHPGSGSHGASGFALVGCDS